MTKYLVMCVFALTLLGCSSAIDGNDYKELSPTFNLYEFFDGNVKAWGIVQNRSKKIVQRFNVDIRGKITDHQLILNESFTYGLGDGVTHRVWNITQNADGSFTGKASDIIDAAIGTPYGNGFNFMYSMNLPVDDTTYKVNFNDWFWAFDENTMMNRSYITKFGFVVAEVTIFMQRQ